MKGDYIMAQDLNVNVTGFNLPPLKVEGTFTVPSINILGQNGKSAYEIWLEAGNTGTKDDFLNSLKGTNGNPGLPGKDASTEGAYEMLLGLNVYCENSTPNEVLKGLIRGLGDVIKKQPKPFNFKRPSQGQTYISVSGTPYFRVALLGRGFAAGISLGENGVAQIPLDEPFNTKDVELEYFNMLGSIVGTYRVSGYASGEVTGPSFGAFIKDVPLTTSTVGVTVVGKGKVYEKGVKVIPTTLESTGKFNLENMFKTLAERVSEYKKVEFVEFDLTQLPNSPAKGGNFPEVCNNFDDLVSCGDNTIIKVNQGQVITVSEDPMIPNQTGVATSIKFNFRGINTKKIQFNGSELITMERDAKYEYVFATDTINKVG